jgi:hypothetical protein
MDSLLKLARRVLPYAVAALAAEHYLRGIAEQMISVRPDIIDFGVYFHAAQAFAAGHHIYPVYSGCCFDQGRWTGTRTRLCSRSRCRLWRECPSA